MKILENSETLCIGTLEIIGDLWMKWAKEKKEVISIWQSSSICIWHQSKNKRQDGGR